MSLLGVAWKGVGYRGRGLERCRLQGAEPGTKQNQPQVEFR